MGSIFALIILCLIILSIIAKIYFIRRYVDIFHETHKARLRKFKYSKFEIKRKRRVYFLMMGSNFTEHPLDAEYSDPHFRGIEDIIEVYGIENKNEYTIYKTNWTKQGAEDIRNIVNELNKEYLAEDN